MIKIELELKLLQSEAEICDYRMRLQDMHRRAQRAEGQLAKTKRRLRSSQEDGRYWFASFRNAQDQVLASDAMRKVLRLFRIGRPL